jgi:hypothetical protein
MIRDKAWSGLALVIIWFSEDIIAIIVDSYVS